MSRRAGGEPAREFRLLTDPLSLNKAFELAHSIYRFREEFRTNALGIVIEALQALDVQLAAQLEADRHDPQRPTKVRWNKAQWFQILILCKSAKYEMQHEDDNDDSLSREDMIIRYLKHFAVTTFRRNSFHVSLGLSRLVYGYSAADAVAIYDLIFQDPDVSTRKADAYYRARKSKLIEEFEKRFHRFLRIEEGSRSEKRFQLDPESTKFSTLVVEYLTRFTPWGTACELPRKLDGWTTITSLQSSQASQIHALVHPSCFARIIETLKLAAPEQSLALPRFLLKANTPRGPATSSNLSDNEIDEIQRTLKDDQEKRNRFKPQSLRVVIDGVEIARLTLGREENIKFSLRGDSTMIEIFGRDDDRELLLATHVVTHQNGGSLMSSPEQYAVVLEGGQRISITIRDAELNGQIVELNYREKEDAVFSRLQKFSQRLFGIEAGRLKDRFAIPVLALILLAAIGGVLILFNVSRRSGDQVARVEPTPQLQISPPATEPSPSPQRTASAPAFARSPVASPKTTPSTRDQSQGVVTSLAQVRNIYVQSFGVDSFSQTLRDKAIEKLHQRFNVTTGPDDADTAVAGSVTLIRQPDTAGGGEVGLIQIRFLNASGETIWQTRRYRGSPTAIADQFAGDLKAALEREQTRQKRE